MKERKTYYLYVFFIVLIISGFWFRYFSIKYITNIDEYESIAVPMYFNNVMWTNSKSFHGYGATILCAPFLHFFGQTGNIYWIFLLESLIIRIICSCITFSVCINKLCVDSKLSFFISIICNIGSLGVTDSAGLSAMTEQPLCLITILVALWVADFIDYDDTKKKRISLIKILCALLYGITIHSRVLVLLGVVVLLFICLAFYKKVSVGKLLLYFAIGGALFVFTNKANDIFISKLYGEVTDVNTISTVVTYGKTENVSFITNLHDTIYGFFSLIESYMYYSYGYIIVLLLLNIKKIYMGLKSHSFDVLWVFSFIGVMSFFSMNIMLSYASKNWLWEGEYKFLTYTRYAMPFTWVLVFTGLILLFNHEDNHSYVGFQAYFLTIVLSCHYVFRVARMLDQTKYGLGTSVFGRFFYQGGSVEKYFVHYTVLILFIQASTLIFMYKKRFFISVIPYVVVSVLLQNALFHHFKGMDEEFSSIYDSCISIMTSDCCKDAEEIYVVGDSSSTVKRFEARLGNVQLSTTEDERYKLKNGLAFVFSELPVFSETEDELYVIRQDKKRYILTANDDLYNAITDYLDSQTLK